MSQLFANVQKIVPQHLLSRVIGRIANSESAFVRRIFIEQFARAYDVDLAQADRKSLTDYASFNDFFTRALEPNARPMPVETNALACPADGTVSQLGPIRQDQLLQAKGHRYSIHSLAGAASAGLLNGDFITVYLAPRDYHRVHVPYAGTLEQTVAIPGALFSVNASTERTIEGLFCRNERLVCRFRTEFGPMLIIMVGAMIVASIDTVWDGPISPYKNEVSTDYELALERGAEMGRFRLGSTVICCFPPGAVELDQSLAAGATVKMGQTIATLANP